MSSDQTYSEKEILKGCRHNDRKSQKILYQKHFPVMMSMCMRHTRDENTAISIVNDGFLRVFKKIHQFRNDGSLQGWIRRIIYHSISDHFRHHKEQVYYLTDEAISSSTDNHDPALEKLYYQDLLECIDALPPRSRDVFRSFILEGYSHQEIAEKLGISIGTSKWHVNHARQKLQTLIQIKS